MPGNMSKERIDLLKGYGAEVVLTPAKDYMVGSNKKAEELAETLPGAFLVGQGFNPNNPAMHIKTTGPEIWMEKQIFLWRPSESLQVQFCGRQFGWQNGQKMKGKTLCLCSRIKENGIYPADYMSEKGESGCGRNRSFIYTWQVVLL